MKTSNEHFVEEIHKKVMQNQGYRYRNSWFEICKSKKWDAMMQECYGKPPTKCSDCPEDVKFYCSYGEYRMGRKCEGQLVDDAIRMTYDELSKLFSKTHAPCDDPNCICQTEEFQKYWEKGTVEMRDSPKILKMIITVRSSIVGMKKNEVEEKWGIKIEDILEVVGEGFRIKGSDVIELGNGLCISGEQDKMLKLYHVARKTKEVD